MIFYNVLIFITITITSSRIVVICITITTTSTSMNTSVGTSSTPSATSTTSSRTTGSSTTTPSNKNANANTTGKQQQRKQQQPLARVLRVAMRFVVVLVMLQYSIENKRGAPCNKAPCDDYWTPCKAPSGKGNSEDLEMLWTSLHASEGQKGLHMKCLCRRPYQDRASLVNC